MRAGGNHGTNDEGSGTSPVRASGGDRGCLRNVTVIAAATLVIAGFWNALAWILAADTRYGGFRVALWALVVLLTAVTVRDWLLAPAIRWCDAIEAGRTSASLENQEKRRDLGYPE